MVEFTIGDYVEPEKEQKVPEMVPVIEKLIAAGEGKSATFTVPDDEVKSTITKLRQAARYADRSLSIVHQETKKTKAGGLETTVEVRVIARITRTRKPKDSEADASKE